MKCKYCNNKLKGAQRKFCCPQCRNNWYYHNNPKYRERIKGNALRRHRELKDNPKYKVIKKKNMDKWRANHKERFNALVMKSYYKTKERWNCRSHTRDILDCKTKVAKIEKKCQKCGSLKNLMLLFEVYPQKAKAIREAIEQKKIYYLCKKCHIKVKYRGGLTYSPKVSKKDNN